MKSELLKGSYEIANEKDIDQIQNTDADIDKELMKIFEHRAAQHLGGSIAFVAKDKLLWEDTINDD